MATFDGAALVGDLGGTALGAALEEKQFGSGTYFAQLGAAGGDTTPPEVGGLTPTPDTAPGSPGGFAATYSVARGTAIEFDVTDEEPGLRLLTVHCAIVMPVGAEPIRGMFTVFRANAFQDLFTESTVTPIDNGVHLAVRRDGGWPAGSQVSLDVDAVDGAGNMLPTGEEVVTLESIAVTPASSTFTQTSMADRGQMTAIGTYSDGSTLDLTTVVTWSSSDVAVATISNTSGTRGQVAAVAAGSTTIMATLDDVSGTAALAVVITLLSVAVTPAASTWTPATTSETRQMTATGTYSNGTTADLTSAATWTSGTPSIATISNVVPNVGKATSVAHGSTTITATVGAVSGSTSLAVSITLASIAVTPAASTFTPTGPSDRQQMTATGTYTNATTADLTTAVTWSSGTPSVATISNAGGTQGKVAGLLSGSSTITATLGAVSGNTPLTVAITLSSIAVTPAASTFTSTAPADRYQMTATGTYTNGATANITTSVTWASTATSIATISNTAGSEGKAAAVASGSTTISATLGAVSGSTSLAVVVVAFSGAVALVGDSNVMGAASYNATGQSDTGYGVSDTSGYAAARLIARWSASIVDPIVWSNLDDTLRAYAAPPALNVGSEQTLGRRLVELGIHASPIITKIGLSGATQHTHFRTDSTFPVGGGNVHAQTVAYLQAKETLTGKANDVIVIVLGENDTANTTYASATQVDLGNIIGGIRTGLGRATQLVYVVIVNSNTTGTYTSTVRSQQIAYVASDPYCRAIYVDDIPLASNPHYGANGYYTIGNRIAQQINVDFFADVPRNRGTGPAPWLEDWGSAVTIAASGSGTPRAGTEERDGDWQLLIVTGQSAVATHSLSVAAGFGLKSSFESLFGGTNHRSMAIYERGVTTAAIVANGNGRMANPTVSAGAAQSSLAVIVTLRGPNAWTTSPIDIYATGANNANSTALSIAGGTTAVANELALIITSVPATSSTGPLSSTVVNANIASITKRRESIVNQASFVGYSLWSGTVAAASTVLGSTAVTMAAAGVNVGCLITVKP